MEGGAHLAALISGRQRHALDEAADRFAGFPVRIGIAQSLGQSFHLAAVDLRDARMQIRCVAGRIGEAALDLVAQTLQLAQPGMVLLQ